MRNTSLAPALVALAWGLAACSDLSQPQPGLEVEDGARVQWSGTLPCADCAGIHTSLVLGRDGEHRRWRMAETYLTAGEAERFVQGGRWHSGDGLVVLEGTDGGLRTWAVLPDGRLQLRDDEGRPLPGHRSVDTLTPGGLPGP